MAPIRSSEIRMQFTVVRNMQFNVYFPRQRNKRKVVHYREIHPHSNEGGADRRVGSIQCEVTVLDLVQHQVA